jgi:hypothetical protein
LRWSALVNTARAVSEHLGYTAELNEAGSANLNVALGAGPPAIGLGGSRGGDRGQPTEWADIDALVRTAHHVMLFGVFLRFGQSPALRSRPVRKVGFLQSGVG